MHFDDDMIVLEKWQQNKPISAIYFDGEKDRYYIKRFLIELTEKEELFISSHPKSQLEIVSTDYRPIVEIQYSKRSIQNQELNLEDFIAVKGIKAQGNQLTTEKIKQVNLLDPLPYVAAKEQNSEEIEVIDEVVVKDQLPIEVPEIKEVSEDSFSINKSQIALKKSIAKKNAEKNNEGDDSQTKLF